MAAFGKFAMLSLLLLEVKTKQGGFDLTVTGITCKDFTIGRLDLAPAPGAVIELAVEGITASCKAHFSYKFGVWPHKPSGEGNVLLSLGGDTHTSVGMQLSSNGGVPKLAAVGCSTKVTVSSLQFGENGHNTMETILNQFRGHLKPLIGGAIEGPVCGSLNDAVNDQANAALATFSPIVRLGATAVDFSLLRAASSAATPSYVSLMLRGAASGTTLPAESFALPDHDAAIADKMAEVLLLPYVFESVAASMVESGRATAVVTSEMIPKDIPFQLTTDAFADIAPGMAARYPGVHDLQIRASAAATPTLLVQGGEVVFSAPIEVLFSVETTVSAAAPASMTAAPVAAPLFKLTCTLEGGVTPRIEGSRLKGTLENVKCGPLVLAENDTGDDVALANLDMLVSYVVVPQATAAVNAVLEEGFKLPSFDGFELANAELDLEGPYVRVATDVAYSTVLPTGSFVDDDAVVELAAY